ncbi:MAG: hypothetical protein R6U40_09200, partial [Desulfobacterales bacterium]
MIILSAKCSFLEIVCDLFNVIVPKAVSMGGGLRRFGQKLSGCRLDFSTDVKKDNTSSKSLQRRTSLAHIASPSTVYSKAAALPEITSFHPFRRPFLEIP